MPGAQFRSDGESEQRRAAGEAEWSHRYGMSATGRR
jgi:hypothetical protein